MWYILDNISYIYKILYTNIYVKCFKIFGDLRLIEWYHFHFMTWMWGNIFNSSMHILVSYLMRSRHFVLIYLKCMKTYTNMYKLCIWFMIKFSKDIFENLDHIIVLFEYMWNVWLSCIINTFYFICQFSCNTCFFVLGKFWIT